MPLFNSIICGDALSELKKMPDEFVDLVITSPPYYALRNYQVDGQLGLEKTFAVYQEKLLAIIAEIKRVLKLTGQFWINLGDIYGTGSGAGSRKGTKQATNTGSNYYENEGKNPPGEAKCLMMMPERIALKMIDEQGWILRNKIRWAKQILIKKENRTIGSVMPTSVKDRFNESGEELYFFVKNKKYYSDLDAVRLKIQCPDDRAENGFVRSGELYPNSKYNTDDPLIDGRPQFKASEEEINSYGKGSEFEQKYGEPWDRFEKKTLKARMADTKNKDQKSSRTYNIKKLLSEVRLGIKPNTGMVPNKVNDSRGKNLPTIWQIGSEPHNFQRELGVDIDHFAIFPQALCEIPIKFGSPKGGLVLDPFAGSGTALIVAKKLSRNYIGIELSPKYVALAEERILRECPPMFF